LSAREQRRGRRIAMSSEERDAFLAAERTCRVATINGDGSPHISPLWFVWYQDAVWLNSLVKSQRWTNIMRDPRVAVVIDGGHDYGELRGVEIIGRAEVVGEVPRTGLENPVLDEPERLNALKYADGIVRHDGRHAWLRVVPQKIVSWDFTKLGLREAPTS